MENNSFAAATTVLSCQQKGKSAFRLSFYTFERTGNNAKCFCGFKNKEKYALLPIKYKS